MIVRDSFEPLEFAGGKFHRILQKISDKCRVTPILNQKRGSGRSGLAVGLFPLEGAEEK
jgi:hypothetical protein